MRSCFRDFRHLLFSGFFLGIVCWVFGLILYLFLRCLINFFCRELRWVCLSYFLGGDLGFRGTFGDFKELLNTKCQKVVFDLKSKTLVKALLVEAIIDHTSHGGGRLGLWDDRWLLLRHYHSLSLLGGIQNWLVWGAT